MNLPNFNRRRRAELQPITFVPVEKAFKPQVEVYVLRDLNGWVSRDYRKKWHLPKGWRGCIDADKAREFHAKGYVVITNGDFDPISADEAAEMLSQNTTITLGAG